jgi:dimethylamine/trimethylamine dehydrogenase
MPRREPRHDILFEPVRIGPKVLRNRFYQVPHCTGFGTDRPWSQAWFRGMKAEGGWAGVCTELCSIHPETDRAGRPCARLWDDDDARNLSLMCEMVHAHGSLAGVELWHGGPSAEGSASREVPGGPSQLPSDMNPLSYPREMDEEEIADVQRFYSEAAVRALKAGFDIIYVYGAHGFLPLQFLSSFFNKRTDKYGGPLEGRARFWLETLEAVRAATNGECAIATRLSVDALGPGGLAVDEALEFVKLADPLVDLWDVNIGSMVNIQADVAASRLEPEGWQLPLTGRVREVTAKPIVGVGRLTDPDRMADIVSNGVWDLIGGARPSIADPFLPKKIEEGRYNDIRQCIGCNVCISRALGTLQIACTQNATAGEEYRRRWHPERFTKADNSNLAVAIIGAGPAGMECAVVLGKRGMKAVHLIDARDEIGGIVNMAALLPGLAEWARITNWRRAQLARLANVDVVTGLELDVSAAREYGADIIIVATGASWRKDGASHVTHAAIPGAELPHVVTPELIISGCANIRGRVLVYDCEGYYMGVGMTELLANRGHPVAFATPSPVVAPFLDTTDEGPPVRQRLIDKAVDLRTDTTITAIEKDITHSYQFGRHREDEFETVVLVTSRQSNDKLYRALVANPEELSANGIKAVYAIGDCVAPRLIADCIFDGHRLAREIDSPNPRRPLPYARELPLVHAAQREADGPRFKP